MRRRSRSSINFFTRSFHLEVLLPLRQIRRRRMQRRLFGPTQLLPLPPQAREILEQRRASRVLRRQIINRHLLRCILARMPGEWEGLRHLSCSAAAPIHSSRCPRDLVGVTPICGLGARGECYRCRGTGALHHRRGAIGISCSGVRFDRCGGTVTCFAVPIPMVTLHDGVVIFPRVEDEFSRCLCCEVCESPCGGSLDDIDGGENAVGGEPRVKPVPITIQLLTETLACCHTTRKY